MSPKIKLLDQHCVNQIAAGEVVERPLSVVKELVENSLDAQARQIDIQIEKGTTTLIRIKDDGIGIAAEDLQLAILPHATSKLSSIQDLDHLSTLGFRGEALPSIASVSKLRILSRPSTEIAGVEIQVEGGRLVATQETGCPPGTVVSVQDLFFNTPARSKFLRSASTEFGYISDMVSRLALARPDVSFTLRHANHLVLQTPGSGNLLETIAAILGNATARKLIPLSLTEQNLQISGYLSPPDLVRSANTGITFLVNGRVIRSTLLNQALKEGYHTLIPAGMHPIAILHIALPPAAYDVNVHPAKLEVKFEDEKALYQKLAGIVRSTLLTARPIRNLFNTPKENNRPFLTKDQEPSVYRRGTTNRAPSAIWEQQKILYAPTGKKNEPKQNGLVNNPNNVLKKETKQEERSDTIQDDTRMFADPNKQRSITTIEPLGECEIVEQTEGLGKLPAEDDNYGQEKDTCIFSELRAIGQVFSTYLLCTDGKSLFIIDQHAAHERIQYEELRMVVQQQELSSQLLLLPEAVTLTVQEEQIVLQNLSELQAMGFIVEHFGDRTYLLRGMPILRHLHDVGKVFRLFLDQMLSQNVPPARDRLLEEWVFMVACRTSIKGNDRLTLTEMDALIERLANTENPLSCPHGRPTIIEVTQKELENRFNR